MVNEETPTPQAQPDTVQAETAQTSTLPTEQRTRSKDLKPSIPQWGTLIWGLILTLLTAVTLWWLLTGRGEWWSFLLLLDETQRILVPMIALGGLLLVLGLLAFLPRRNR